MLEIKFSGRGGQGVVVASQMLGLAFFKAGKYPQCYSVFGGERRGAPLASFLRVDKNKILLKCEIKNPDHFICFDDRMLDTDEVKSMLKPQGSILINTSRSPGDFTELSDYRIGLVDSSAIARDVGLGQIFNTGMVGAYCGFTGQLPMETVVEAVKEMAPARSDANAEASRIAFDHVVIIEPGGAHGGSSIS
jgi:2-oxoacid:acceptor oxidoreductase gamma subunit (pyruvate/2-ketoisovalerate family)